MFTFKQFSFLLFQSITRVPKTNLLIYLNMSTWKTNIFAFLVPLPQLTPKEMLTKILRLELQTVEESQKLQESVWERRV